MGGSRSSTWLKKSGAADTLSVSRWLSSEECREEKDCRDLHDSLRALPAAVVSSKASNEDSSRVDITIKWRH